MLWWVTLAGAAALALLAAAGWFLLRHPEIQRPACGYRDYSCGLPHRA